LTIGDNAIAILRSRRDEVASRLRCRLAADFARRQWVQRKGISAARLLATRRLRKSGRFCPIIGRLSLRVDDLQQQTTGLPGLLCWNPMRHHRRDAMRAIEYKPWSTHPLKEPGKLIHHPIALCRNEMQNRPSTSRFASPENVSRSVTYVADKPRLPLKPALKIRFEQNSSAYTDQLCVSEPSHAATSYSDGVCSACARLCHPLA